MRVKFWPIVAVALTASAVVAASASAHTFRTPSDVKITKGGPDGAQGVVTSRREWCESGRLVTLYYVNPEGSLTKIRSDRTDANGRWRVDAPLVAGEYVVEVSRKQRRAFRHWHLCRPDRSPRKLL